MVQRYCLSKYSLGAAMIAVSAFAWDATQSIAKAAIDGPKVSWKFSTWGKLRAYTVGIELLAKRLDEETNGNAT